MDQPLDDLKPREIEILNLIAEGHSNQEIADRLFITKGTVRWYNKQIYSKLGTSRRTEAIALARAWGFIGDQEQTPAAPTTAHRRSLPLTTGPFVGRDAELAELRDLLQNPETRLLSIIAAGGMGKSRLSLELGHLIQDDFEHGAAFIDLTAVRTPQTIAAVAADSLGLAAVSDGDPQDILFNYCREKSLLLIFDNFEHVLAGADLLTHLLETAPHVTIIATSRERLNLRVESAYFLPPVTADADTLFIEVARMMRPDIEFTDNDAPTIGRIVQLVGGLPLALTLAATWADVLTPQEIADEIEASLEFLSSDMADMPPRQRSIHAVIDPTWKRLDEAEQAAFMMASVFRGGFTRDLFQAVTGASVRTLQNLLNRSLISAGYARRFDMHPLMRQFAREKLNAAGLLHQAKAKHLAAYRDYAQEHDERLYNGHYLESLDLLNTEQDNFRAALAWSLAGEAVDEGIALLLALCEFWMIRSQAREALGFLQQASEHRHRLALLYWRAYYEERLGNIQHAKDGFQEATQQAMETDDRHILAWATIRLVTLIEAFDRIEAAIDIAQALGDMRLVAHGYNILGLVNSPHANTRPDAIAYFETALAIYKQLGDLRGISMITNNLAITLDDQHHNSARAKELLRYSLDIKRQIGDRAGEARRLTTLSLGAMYDEEFEQAAAWLAESQRISEELGETNRLAYALYSQGLLGYIMMDMPRARAFFEQSRARYLSLGDFYVSAEVEAILCMICLLEGDLDRARAHLAESIAYTQKAGPSYIHVYLAYANYLWQVGDIETAAGVAAAMQNHHFKATFHPTRVDEKYFLNPLLYRAQKHIGDAAWQQALDAAAEATPQAIFDEMAAYFGVG